jgi:hypothetical protein
VVTTRSKSNSAPATVRSPRPRATSAKPRTSATASAPSSLRFRSHCSPGPQKPKTDAEGFRRRFRLSAPCRSRF